jgi:DNA primase
MEGQGMISREIIEEIRSRNDIVELIGTYVNLKRAGSNYNGLCPYHSEKSPSFTVFPNTQSFYCFGCGAGGDAITFAMKSENLDYTAAVEFLAKRAGITITVDDRQDKGGITKQRILQMNLEAAKYFRACLWDEKVGKIGMDYLMGNRKLSPATIKHFGLGYAPNGFGGLTDHMHKKGFTDEELIVGFLCGKSQKTGKAYDYFRNRVIFPIINTSGDVIAFGGRVMDDSKPKYLNSSDTPGFKKSKNLFALNFAKNHCSERMILCEGYMDVIALHAAGFENAVATLGTALTQEQARMMAKYTKQVIISYDSDEAGQAATRKAVRMLSDVGLDVKILRMDGAKDPDEYIKKRGSDSFRSLLDSSRTGFEFKLESALAKYNLLVAEDKIKASGEMCEYISDVWSGVEREIYIAAVAKRLGISEEGLKNDVEMLRRKKIQAYKDKTAQQARLGAMGVGDKINSEAIKNIKARAAEEAVIGLVLMYEENRDLIMSKKVELTSSDFVSEFHSRAFDSIMKLHEQNQYDFAMLGQFLTPDEMGRLQGLEQKRRALAENGRAVFEECVKTVREEKKLANASADGIDEIRMLLEKKRGAQNK